MHTFVLWYFVHSYCVISGNFSLWSNTTNVLCWITKINFANKYNVLLVAVSCRSAQRFALLFTLVCTEPLNVVLFRPRIQASPQPRGGNRAIAPHWKFQKFLGTTASRTIILPPQKYYNSRLQSFCYQAGCGIQVYWIIELVVYVNITKETIKLLGCYFVATK